MKVDKYLISKAIDEAGLKKKDVAIGLKLKPADLSKRLAGNVPFSIAEKGGIAAMVGKDIAELFDN